MSLVDFFHPSANPGAPRPCLDDLRRLVTNPSHAVTELVLDADGGVVVCEVTNCVYEIWTWFGTFEGVVSNPREAFHRCKLRGLPSLGPDPDEARVRAAAAARFGLDGEDVAGLMAEGRAA